MMNYKKTILALMCIFSFSTSANADDTHSNADATKSNGYNIVESTDIVRNSSEYYRLEKKYQIVAQLFGVGPSLASATGLEGGYFLDKDTLVLLQITSASRRYDYSSTYGSVYKLTADSLGLHFKKFFSNSFYIRSGLDYRRSSYSYQYTSISGVTDIDRSFSGDSLALNFQIGNQWQWQNFTLGCDWIGYSLPVFSQINKQSVYSLTDISYDTKRNIEDQDILIKNGHMNVLRFYLGVSF